MTSSIYSTYDESGLDKKKKMQEYRLKQSEALFNQIGSEGFHSFVQFSRVLGHSVLHLDVRVESSNQDELFRYAYAGSSFGLI